MDGEADTRLDDVDGSGWEGALRLWLSFDDRVMKYDDASAALGRDDIVQLRYACNSRLVDILGVTLIKRLKIFLSLKGESSND